MINSSIYKRLLLAFGVIFFIACDKDFNQIDSDIIEDDIHHNNMTRFLSNVAAFDRPTGPVQANNLPLNSLGIYKNPAFGKTTAHFVTQLKMTSGNPTFTSNVNIDTVYLYVPYFSRLTANNPDGSSDYELDSIYGNINASMKLNIYENKFFLRDSDPGTTFLSGQRYYSNQFNDIYANRNPVRLNNNAAQEQNDQFRISASQVRRMAPIEEGSTTFVVAERFAPGIFAYLDTDFFEAKITNAPEGKLVNQNVFKEWFRGLLFHIEENSNDGAMATMNFQQGKITIIYHQDKLNLDGTPVLDENGDRVQERKTLTLDMDETSATPINTVNFFVNDYSTGFLSAINSTDDPILGDKKLYLKGGEGSMAFINLDNASVNSLKESQMGQKVLINEANLTFYVDQSATLDGGLGDVLKEDEPLRVYLYDVKNKRPLYDYYTDVTTNTLNPKKNKAVHDGIIQRDAEGKGYRYRIRLTNYINNIEKK
jgi:hypothetical protein